MPTRQKRLVIATGIFLFVVTLGWNLFSDARDASMAVAPPATEPTVIAASPTATPVPVATLSVTSEPRQARFEYSIALAELDGMSPDVEPGTAFDLWVTYEPPLVEKPDVYPLLRDVALVRVILPVVPEGPTVVVLSIPRVKNAVRAMILGDQYGRLSVVADG
ncbi:MAG: hypothetical protein ACRDKT_13035 [Actinomycetota bacterium]